MIGQKRNLEMIDKWVADGCPQFFCISGSRGGGKRLLAQILANKLDTTYSEVGIKVDDVREVIDSAIKYGGFYVFADADSMSTNAKNALLKITEEPPKNSYFVVTVEDEASLLDTIKSRAQMIR
jgi:DNA polymerase III delta prime subunit